MRGIIALDLDVVESSHRFLSADTAGQVDPRRRPARENLAKKPLEGAWARDGDEYGSPSLWSVRHLAGDFRGIAFSLRVNLLLSRQLHTYTYKYGQMNTIPRITSCDTFVLPQLLLPPLL